VELNRAQEVFSALDFSILQVKQYINVVRMKESQSFNKMMKKVEKFNARAVKSEIILKLNSGMLSEAIAFTKNTVGKTILCFDVEVLETCHRLILEIGWCTYKTGKNNIQESDIHSKHYIIQENLTKKNGRHVPDHKHLFSFGTSEIRPLKYVITEFMQDLIEVDCVIGHSVDSDFKFLQTYLEFSNLDEFMILLDSKKYKRKNPDDMSVQIIKFRTLNITGQIEKRMKKFPIQVKKFDTMFMTSAVLGDAFNDCGLQRALQLFDMTKNDEYIFHNAGNDAFATMKLFLALVHEANVDSEHLTRF
jgi:DNA polymerase III epsilon subunit-like protein